MTDAPAGARPDERASMRWVVLLAGAAWFAVVFELAVSETRRELVGLGTASNSVAHLLAFAGLAGVLYSGAPARSVGHGRTGMAVGLTVLGICAALGLAIELGQLASDTRTFQVSDLVFDLLGAWLGLATAMLAARAVGWRSLATGVLVLLGASLLALPLARSTDAVAGSSATALDCPARAFEPAQGAGTPGPVLEYPLSEGEGTMIADSGGRTSLVIGEPDAVTWSTEGVTISGPPDIASPEPPVDLLDAVKASDEVSVEAWMVAERLPQEGPARVATISSGTANDDVNVHLGVERRGVSVRVRTDCDLLNWTIADDVLTAGARHHVVATYRPGQLVIYVDGEVVTQTRVRVGVLDDWDDGFRLHLGDEAGGNRELLGTLEAVALFDRALEARDVAARFVAGPA